MTAADELKPFIRDVPDFPKPGIVFKDITPLLLSPEALARSIELLAEPFRDAGVTRVAAIEARGFIFGSCVARALGAGFVPIRKPRKLPWTTHSHEYALEYGTDTLEIHRDALTSADRVLLVDDLLATGGTLGAAIELVGLLGARLVGIATVIELEFLGGRQKLSTQAPIHTLIQY